MARGKKKQTSVLSYVTVSLVTVVVICVLLIWTKSLIKKNNEYKERESQLYEEIAEQNSLYDELNEQYEYIKTDDYIKDMAEAYFGLINEGDILIKPRQ